MTNLKKILSLLSSHERKKIVFLLSMILIMALLDVMGVASIMPFITVMMNPEVIKTNAILIVLYDSFNFTSESDFTLFLGVSVFLLLVISISFKALVTYMQLRFIMLSEYSIGLRLIEGYLHKPYTWFLHRHSADLGKAILSEVGEVVHGAMLPILMIIVHGTVSLFIIILLIYIDIELALIVASVLITFYLLIFQFMKKTLTNIGSARLSANKERYTSVSEAFGAIKEIKVRGLEGYFSDQFSKPAKIYANSQISSQMRAQLPRYALEIIAFGGLLLMMLVSMRSGGNINDTLPIISLYAFAGYRLIPALQQVYSGFTVTRYSSPSLESLHNDMKTLTHNYYTDKSARIKFKKSIKLNDVNFSYPRSKRPSLSGVNIEIPVHSIIGFVGSTGSGKTTMVDLIMGLLVQQQGSLSVDGEVIDSNNRHQWQQCIGYVPQQIHLSDDSIASNIAFGVEKNKINQKSIERAAKIANLHEFVVDELPEGYATIVGERGVRLSGGQRQRIGIARALYHMPQVLILDEATSALDSLTELAVMESVNNLGHDITIIIIAHRLSTVRQCDQIYLLEGGCIGISGTYDQLKKNSNKFKSMVNV